MEYKEVNRNVYFKCKSTRNTERVTLVVNDEEVGSGYYSWQNRPWQRFEYCTAMNKALDKAVKNGLSDYYRRLISKWIEAGGRQDNSWLKTVGMVASLGNIMAGEDIKAKNDWKTRMLKAGLENQGLIMPDDWSELSEDEKASRLDKAINEIVG